MTLADFIETATALVEAGDIEGADKIIVEAENGLSADDYSAFEEAMS